jgi:DNA invertase Pin-like site-specific DNA recombinase
MIKYIAYCRKSTDEADRQILSIEAQTAELKEFAKRENLEIVEFFIEAKTAKKPGREKFEQMLKLIEKGDANGILSWHADRLARNSVDGGKIIYLLDTGKIQSLKFPTLWFKNTPQGKFMLSIAFGQSKYYIDNLSENVKRGIRQKLRNGVYPNKAPIGYFNEPRKRTIEVDSKIARLVRKTFQLFATGKYTYVDIDKFFFEQGIKNSTNKYLRMDKIRNMLRSPFYYGVFEFAGETYQGTHKPIISKTLFDKCQEVIKRKSKTHINHKDEFWFLGLAKCIECNSAITAEKHFKFYPKTRGKVRYDYYRCGKKHGYCSQKYVSSEEFEKQIRKILWRQSLHELNAKRMLNWLHADETAEKKTAENKISLFKSQLSNVEQKLDRLLTGYLDQVIETNEYQAVKKKLIEEKTNLEEQILSFEKNQFLWVELVKDFINSALEAHKIARAKNNGEELSFFAKKVGSNYFLSGRRLEFVPLRGFNALAAPAPAASAPLSLPNLRCVFEKIRTDFARDWLSGRNSPRTPYPPASP